MATRVRAVVWSILVALLLAANIGAQQFPTDDPVLRAIWEEGTTRGQTWSLAQTLMDSIGPRLTGTPGQEAAADWVIRKYTEWGIEARNETYGTWRGWRRGITHVDLMEPRVRSLEAMMLAWSPGSSGMRTGEAIVPPEFESAADFESWLTQVEGKFVLLSAPQPTCRPDDNWEEYATESSFAALREERANDARAWAQNWARSGITASPRALTGAIAAAVEEAGAAGVLTSRWSNGWGVQKIFSASTSRIPTIDVSCEDYGLVYLLAHGGQGPVLRVHADAEFTGEVPVANTIGMIRGSELPDEYVVLSAHFDSWDGGSGATDNGTGTITMLEAMRILSEVYPQPKRTILVGHWNGEEQGLNGSRSFAADHPEVVDGLQVLFNQDNGTGRVVSISMQGLTGAGAYFADWLSQIPSEISQQIKLNVPGNPGSGGSDYASFICAGAPAFSLSSLRWEYRTYTWHTNRDTFDKVVFDDLRNNAILTAMLVYLASEEPDRLPRDRRTQVFNARSGRESTWPTCRDGARSFR